MGVLLWIFLLKKFLNRYLWYETPNTHPNYFLVNSDIGNIHVATGITQSSHAYDLIKKFFRKRNINIQYNSTAFVSAYITYIEDDDANKKIGFK